MTSVLSPHPTLLHMRPAITKKSKISVVGKVVSGLPISMITKIEDYPFFPEHITENENIFMIHANRCQILDSDILDNDYLIVRKQARTRKNSLVLITSSDNQMQVLPWHKQQTRSLTTRYYNRRESEQMVGQIIGILRPCSPNMTN